MSKVVIAIDLGGTNLRLAAVNSSGEILYNSKSDTPRSNRAEDILESISQGINECLNFLNNNFEVQMIAAAVPGTVDFRRGIILKAPNLPCLNGIGFAKILSERVGIPTILENDANAAAVGENWLGASKGYDDSICITLGTGVGGGVIINEKVVRGIDGTAGEIGHICVEPNGALCGCGSNGCLEQYASATAVTRLALELADKFPEETFFVNSEFSSYQIFEAGKSGSKLALEVFRQQGFYLGIALAGLINVLNPEVIVIGGGAAAGWDLFIYSLNKEIKKRAFLIPAERAKILLAECGDAAGILGAARLGFLTRLEQDAE